jgi:hypothetical protein
MVQFRLKDRTGQDRTGQDRTGQDRTGQDRTGQDRTGQDRTGQESQLSLKAHQSGPASLSWVRVSKSPASWRSCNWLDSAPMVRLTMQPRRTAGRWAIWSVQRSTWRPVLLYQQQRFALGWPGPSPAPDLCAARAWGSVLSCQGSGNWALAQPHWAESMGSMAASACTMAWPSVGRTKRATSCPSARKIRVGHCLT